MFVSGIYLPEEAHYITLWIDDGIPCCRFAAELDLTLDIAKACVEGRIFFARGKHYPLMIDMKGIRLSTRKYLATVGATLVTAGALITGSQLNKAIGSIFLKIDRPPVPTKMFTSEEKAKAWLKQYLKPSVTDENSTLSSGHLF